MELPSSVIAVVVYGSVARLLLKNVKINTNIQYITNVVLVGVKKQPQMHSVGEQKCKIIYFFDFLLNLVTSDSRL